MAQHGFMYKTLQYDPNDAELMKIVLRHRIIGSSQDGLEANLKHLRQRADAYNPNTNAKGPAEFFKSLTV